MNQRYQRSIIFPKPVLLIILTLFFAQIYHHTAIFLQYTETISQYTAMISQ